MSNILTVSDLLASSKLDFKVAKFPIYAAGGVADLDKVHGHMVTRREDTKGILGVVGEGYEVIQTQDCLDLMDALASGNGNGGVKYTRAMSFKGGAVIAVEGTLPGRAEVVKGDWIEPRFTLRTSHDGSSSVWFSVYQFRQICSNGMMGWRKTAGRSIRHTVNWADKAAEAQRQLGFAQTESARLFKAFRRLAEVRVNAAQVKSYVTTLFPTKAGEDDTSRTQNAREDVVRRFRRGMGNHGETAWDLFNGLTEYVDHSRATRGETDAERAENRLQSILFGSGSDLKAEALDLALSIN
jgi:phage/plasmid-like protein (TIGR03299 family)